MNGAILFNVAKFMEPQSNTHVPRHYLTIWTHEWQDIVQCGPKLEQHRFQEFATRV